MTSPALTDGFSHDPDIQESSPGLEGQSGVTTLRWHPARSGSRLGRYRLGARLGLGGAASVYLARLDGPHDFGRMLAVKIIHEHLAEEPEFVSMFLDEANLAVRLQHPNLVHVYELGHEGTSLFLAMEYLHGQTFATVLRALAERGKRLPFDVIAWIGAQAAEGLHYAHELTDEAGGKVGLVHRDISPDNIFVTYDGHIKVIDFGIAHAKGRTTNTELGKIKGKYRYMAPEQALGRDFDHRVDIFALGTTLYEAALCQPLFAGADDAETLGNLLSGPVPDPRTRIPGFPQELTPVLLRALEIEPEDRYPDARIMARELEAFTAERGGGQRDRLATLMQELFEEERAAKGRAIAELKQLRTIPPPAAAAAGNEGRPRRRGVLLLVGAGVVLSSAAGAALLWPSEASAPAPTPSVPASAVLQTITVAVHPQPSADVKIEVDGREISTRPARAQLPKGELPVAIVVRKDGYQTARLEVVPDQDHSLVIPLVRAMVDPPTSAAPASGAPPKVPEPGAAHPAGSPHGSGAPTGTSRTQRPGLATDYPF